MKLTFSGAAREVTGSCHILEVGGRTVLLDCGLFQGRRAESRRKNEVLPLPVESIDAVVLSHAHIDHAGRLPFLVRSGYSGSIHATAATRDLCAIMLADSARIQVKDAEFLERRHKQHAEPLYEPDDATQVLKQMIGLPYDRWFDVVPGVRASFVDAGHILGSASVMLDCTEGDRTVRVVFSGDVGRKDLAIIRDPHPPIGADVVIMESTYGNRDHLPLADARAALGTVVRDTAARGGRVIIPAFAVGRVQELIYDLHSLTRANEIPRVPIYIDSPLATSATEVFERHPECFDRTEDLVRTVEKLFQFDLVHYTRDVQESKALNQMHGPMIIISPSGMAESGRVLHHLSHAAGDQRNTILVVGFMAEHTLGRRIVERRPNLRIFGSDVPLNAHVEVLDGYSAHADRGELTAWLDQVKATSPTLSKVMLVHGEPPAQESLRASLTARGFTVTVPAPGDQCAL
ncbi:MAG: MBL fold metallo-hydrolase [Gemmatimonadaceae bacterium]|nr:MBL fold metallo-hydrolase [Gemmatimonadaceae bacterium]